eukprot:g2675.t1
MEKDGFRSSNAAESEANAISIDSRFSIKTCTQEKQVLNTKQSSSSSSTSSKESVNTEMSSLSSPNSCVVCFAEAAPYKCPNCRVKYCSVACSKQHKADGCNIQSKKRKRNDERSVDNEPQLLPFSKRQELFELAKVNPSAVLAGQDTDTLLLNHTLLNDIDKKKLRNSKSVCTALRDPYLQLLLYEIDDPNLFKKENGSEICCRLKSITEIRKAGESTEFKVACPDCGKGFKSQEGYIRHLLKFAKERWNARNKRRNGTKVKKATPKQRLQFLDRRIKSDKAFSEFVEKVLKVMEL